VLFWLGNTVVDANFSHIGPMSGRRTARAGQPVAGSRGQPALAPPILANLPKDSLDGQTTHYAWGRRATPGGRRAAAGAGGLRSRRGGVTANYSLRSGPATLTIIDYPTPQMAAAQETKIRAYIKAGSQASRRGPSRWPTPTRHRSKCAAAGRWWPW
jgi:hypothetical protein